MNSLILNDLVKRELLTKSESELLLPEGSSEGKKGRGGLIESISKYCCQNEKGVVPFERMFSKEESLLISRIIAVPPHPSFVSELLGVYSVIISSLAIRGENVISLASFVHNSFIYFHPMVDFNSRIARILANYVLCSHGFQPIIRTDSYEKAIRFDMANIKRCDKSMGLRIRIDSMKNFIYSWQKSRICRNCGVSNSKYSCGNCNAAYHCSKECFAFAPPCLIPRSAVF